MRIVTDLGIGSAPARPRAGWHPGLLFRSGARGACHAQADPATVFQDFAGGVPAATGAPVGLVLDTSQGLVRGAHVGRPEDATLVNPDKARYDPVTDAYAIARDSTSGGEVHFSVDPSQFHEIDIEVLADGGAAAIAIRDGSTVLGSIGPSMGRVTRVLKFPAGTVRLNLSSFPLASMFRLHGLRTLAGNHAIQPTVAARPLRARVPATGRRNTLERTEELQDPWWARQAITVADDAGTLDGVPVSRCTTINGQAWGGFTGNLSHDFGTDPGGAIHQFRIRTFGAARYVIVVYSSTASRNFVLDTQTGARQEIVSSQSGNTLAHVEQLADGWWEVAVYSNPFNRFFSVGLQSALSGSFADAFVGDGVSGFEISAPSRVPGEFGAAAVTPYQTYQRVGNAYDVTEPGVAGTWHAANPGAKELQWEAPAGSYTVAHATEAGVTIREAQALAGPTDILLGARTAAHVAIDRGLTPPERDRLVAWLEQRGAGL